MRPRSVLFPKNFPALITWGRPVFRLGLLPGLLAILVLALALVSAPLRAQEGDEAEGAAAVAAAAESELDEMDDLDGLDDMDSELDGDLEESEVAAQAPQQPSQQPAQQQVQAQPQAAAASATAAPQPAADGVVEEITILGTRTPGRSATDIPVPVDSLNASLLQKTGHTEVGRMLQSVAPSFNFSSSSVSDGTDALRPATLRGLGPDQTLVLVNGKRRHTSALIHVNTSVGRGAAGVDMNAIPAASIKRIEVLRDGAAAQYGSDAIAGVINIVLKDNSEEGSLRASYGEYSEGDGETWNYDITKGFRLGEAGFASATLNYRDRGRTNRAGLSGACQYLAGCPDNDNDGIPEAGDPREVTFDRLNFRIGDAESEQWAFTLNAGLEVGAGEVYGFFTYSTRDSTSGGFYRQAAQADRNPTLADGEAFAPDGFLPLINTEIDDTSFGAGYKSRLDGDILFDVSYTYGRNAFDFFISDSVNASFVNLQRYGFGVADDVIRANTRRSASAGELQLALHTINLNFSQPVGRANFAYGVELRRDEYKIKAGEEYSYRDYDTGPSGSLYAADAAGGIQVFPGFSPLNEVHEARDIWSAYFDVEFDITEKLLGSFALRFDDYDDFGSTTNWKIAGSYKLHEQVKLRGAVSTGFRAPSMQQQFFNNISTQFVTVGTSTVAQERGTFRNDSDIAKAIGIPALREEESVNYSAGLIISPLEGWNITVDAYKIDIEDRIVISGGLDSSLGDPNLTAALNSADITSAQFFLNGADTETKGFDVVTSYAFGLGEGDFLVSLAANFTETKVERIFTGGGLANISASQVFTPQDISIIEEWQPENRINLSFDYSIGALGAVLSFNRFGKYTVCEGSCDTASGSGQNIQTFDAKILTDLRFSYAMDNGLSFNLGGNNIFDETPDKNLIGQSRGGIIEDASNNIIVNSPGVFQYSRRSAPFGFNGAYFYAGVGYDF